MGNLKCVLTFIPISLRMATSSCKTALSTHIRVIGENTPTKPHLHICNNITISDLAELGSPIASGSFGDVYRCAINEGKIEVAVKVFRVIINPQRSLEKLQSAMDREVAVWLKLSESAYIVPLLGVAKFSPSESLPALVSGWMPSGTLEQYLKKHAKTLDASARVELSKGVAGGVNYLRLEEVVHGDLHPANVLIDREGNPRLTDFGLATVVGDPELQWGTTTAARELNARWRAPEVLGIEDEVAKPTFMSDIYSLGSILFFIISGDIPWKEKRKSSQISVQLSNKATPTRPENILNGHWNLIQKCWSRKPEDRPDSTEVLECIKQLEVNDSQAPALNQPVDLTGQIIGEIKDLVAGLGGNFTNVYKCGCKQASGRTIKVAVKIIKFSISKEELERFNRETKTWAILEHNHIIRLLGTARDIGPPEVPPALVFPWFETTLPGMIRERGTELNIRSKLDLLLGTASALEYLHGLDIVHGDVISPNILVDISDGRYYACLTDIGMATILGGHLGNRVVDGSRVQLDAVRWTSPELLNDGSPTKENDMYSFGCIMFHLLTLYTPWYTITNDLIVVEHIRRGEQMLRPAPSESLDLTDARWNMILKCWSAMVSRPSASMAIGLLKSELEALSGDDKTICGPGGEHAVPLITDKPSPATSDLSPHITNAPCNGIRQCLPVDVSASEVTDVSDTSIDNQATFVREQCSYRRTSSVMFDAEQRTASGDVTHPTREEDLQPPSWASPDTAIPRNTSRVSTLLPLNVLLFGEAGVDKSSIIQLIVGQNITDAAPGAPYSMLKRTAGVTLRERRFELWEVSSSISFFPRFIAKWRLRASYKRLYRDGGAPLVLYCMKGTSTPTASREYQDFTDIVGSTSCVSISAVVDGLEESLTNMDDWWTKYKGDLIRLGMQFSNHVYITLLPDDPNALRSRETICSLIESYASYVPRHTP
ncbi:kinase-like domain-containing protein [Suillus variegatus]|nr:kinase-like domain-containing protein [Suillus variegatus]